MVELRGALSDDGNLECDVGGDAYNTALYLARARKVHHMDVDFITALGTDALSGELLQRFQRDGVGVAHVGRVPGRLPGLYWVRTDPHGERSFSYWRRGSAAAAMMGGRSAADWSRTLLQNRLVHLSGISLAILDAASRKTLLAALEMLRPAGVHLTFDCNFRAVLWEDVDTAQEAYGAVLAMTDVVFCSVADAVALAARPDPSSILARLRLCRVPEIVVRDGANAALVVAAGYACDVAPGRPAAIVDTTAAGDSFNAGYLAARLAGHGPAEAARWGHALAGVVLGHRGAIAPAAATAVVMDRWSAASC